MRADGGGSGWILPRLIVFSGLPGTGKTTVSRLLARRLGAVHLRVDAIEQALRDSLPALQEVGVSGYAVAAALAAENLRLDRTVIVDCVNPLLESRSGWTDLGLRLGVVLLNVETTCLDPETHRRRLEDRRSDLPGHLAPGWETVMGMDYRPWTEPVLRIDSSALTAEEAATTIQRQSGWPGP